MPTRTSWSQYLQPRLAVMVSTERSNILLNAPKFFKFFLLYKNVHIILHLVYEIAKITIYIVIY